MDRLYVVTRSDLPPCHQACQSGHAVAKFAFRHPIKFLIWMLGKSNLVYLSVPSENELMRLFDKVRLSHSTSLVSEPDFGYEFTALAVAGSAKKQLRSLRLALN